MPLRSFGYFSTAEWVDGCSARVIALTLPSGTLRRPDAACGLCRYHYPLKRVDRDGEGRPRGIMGKVELVNAR